MSLYIFCGQVVFVILKLLECSLALSKCSIICEQGPCSIVMGNDFVKFMNVYTKWRMFKIDLKLWNEKPKLRHLVYELACYISYVYITSSMKVSLWNHVIVQTQMRLTWPWDVSFIGLASIMCLDLGLWHQDPLCQMKLIMHS